MITVARLVRIIGRVQGVFFRAWTRDEARTLGLRGWVRNCSDGSVETYIEGEAEAVEEMLDLIREGPPDARVDNVRIETADPEGLSGFEVRH
jgi:acylphosphatase